MTTLNNTVFINYSSFFKTNYHRFFISYVARTLSLQLRLTANMIDNFISIISLIFLIINIKGFINFINMDISNTIIFLN